MRALPHLLAFVYHTLFRPSFFLLPSCFSYFGLHSVTYCVEKVCSRGLLRHWYLYPFSGNYVQLPSSVRIHVKLGGFSKGVWWMLAMGLGIADLHCRKVESTKWCHVRRAIVWTNQWQIWVSFYFEVRQGMAKICHAGSLKFSSSGLAISMTNLIVQNL